MKNHYRNRITLPIKVCVSFHKNILMNISFVHSTGAGLVFVYRIAVTLAKMSIIIVLVANPTSERIKNEAIQYKN